MIYIYIWEYALFKFALLNCFCNHSLITLLIPNCLFNQWSRGFGFRRSQPGPVWNGAFGFVDLECARSSSGSSVWGFETSNIWSKLLKLTKSPGEIPGFWRNLNWRNWRNWRNRGSSIGGWGYLRRPTYRPLTSKDTTTWHCSSKSWLCFNQTWLYVSSITFLINASLCFVNCIFNHQPLCFVNCIFHQWSRVQSSLIVF